jgi:hypothetical protein
MRKWILWLVVVSIIISMVTGSNNNSSYSSGSGILDTTFW